MKYIEDILIISGLVVVSTATFLLSIIGGLYCTGFILFGLGIWFTRHPPGKE